MTEFQLQILHQIQAISLVGGFFIGFACFFLVVIFIEMSDR